jgi:hypothetical protein
LSQRQVLRRLPGVLGDRQQAALRAGAGECISINAQDERFDLRAFLLPPRHGSRLSLAAVNTMLRRLSSLA